MATKSLDNLFFNRQKHNHFIIWPAKAVHISSSFDDDRHGPLAGCVCGLANFWWSIALTFLTIPASDACRFNDGWTSSYTQLCIGIISANINIEVRKLIDCYFNKLIKL